MPRGIATVELPADGLYPAVVLGWEVDTKQPLPDVQNNAHFLWTAIQHQSGGYLCVHHHVVGLVVRFAGNLDRARTDTAGFFDAFTALSEDPDLEKLERDFPTLFGFTPTAGRPYTTEQLVALYDFVSRSFPVPPFEWGEEAFVLLSGGANAFYGWRIWSCGEEDLMWLGYTNILEVTESEEIVVDERVIRALQAELWPQIESLALQSGFPKAYLLWENSD
jgi:hypothetical protein